MKRVFALAVVLFAAGCGGGKHAGARFSAHVTNPWYPLLPGSTWIYRGVKDGKPAREVMTATHRTRMIAGARCVVISDLLYLGGRPEERTTDYYSQDSNGNVWYFGESTAELDTKGRVKDTTGSWLAGVQGAKAGIFMFTHPKSGRSARQEYYKGQAEDHFQVLQLGASVKVPFITTSHALLTKEW